MAVETQRIFFGFRRSFLEIFFALVTPHGLMSNSKGEKTVFITFLGLKDCGPVIVHIRKEQYSTCMSVMVKKSMLSEILVCGKGKQYVIYPLNLYCHPFS